MKLKHGRHLAYCTNIHRGETWPETFDALRNRTLAVREKIAPGRTFAIGLRLGQTAAVELADRRALREFQRWLDRNDCYVFTVNGFPYGRFHGTRVKEQVYTPDWTTPERLAYTNLLFDLLAELLPAGVPGSVSTVPGSFKEFITTTTQAAEIRENFFRCATHIAMLAEKTGRELHLGLEPEPLCLLENSAETIAFFEQLRADHPRDSRVDEFLGMNYDTCHLAVEYEDARTALTALQSAGVRIGKLHLSSALKVVPTPDACEALERFDDDVYLHQVIARDARGRREFFRDLPNALAAGGAGPALAAEWRIHFHVPLHAPAAPPFANTTDHLLGALDWLGENPGLCPHLEMETYTWEVLPPELKSPDVVDQLAAEYRWTLAELTRRGLA